MAYKKYNGKDKYHFRRDKNAKNHFAVITKSDKNQTEGYLTTTTKPKRNIRKFITLDKNPNPKDNDTTYVRKTKIFKKSNKFTKPFNNFHLSKQDEIKIDNLEHGSGGSTKKKKSDAN